MGHLGTYMAAPSSPVLHTFKFRCWLGLGLWFLTYVTFCMSKVLVDSWLLYQGMRVRASAVAGMRAHLSRVSAVYGLSRPCLLLYSSYYLLVDIQTLAIFLSGGAVH